jgi:membrane protease YdiL (CAAX protease family)
MVSLATLLRKVIFFPLTRMVIAFLAIVIAFIFESVGLSALSASYGLKDQAWFAILSGAVMVGTVCAIYWGYVQLFERRAVTELAVRPAPRELAIGTAIGFGLMSATITLLALGGCYRVEGLGQWPSVATLVTLGVVPAFFEEILMRGIVFRITEESLGTWLAFFISGLLFGLAHLANPNATLVAALSIALEAGVLLAVGYVITRRLWVSIGMHFAWNFALGGIFGVAVSGIEVRGLLKSTLTGPDLLSGGRFGPEASVLAVLVCTSMAIVLTVQAIRAGQIVRPYWTKRHQTPVTDVAADTIALADPILKQTDTSPDF